ncbi:MAG: ABC transporter permease subunit [Acidimicrobiia bacterium]|nr:ABC transporter permease subunit [Acidimicrobiia bacterium]
MFGTVLTKSLRDQVRSFTGWSIGIVVLVVLMVALWPSVRDMPDLETFLANYPEGVKELFGIEAFGTGAGYLNAELFSLMLPAVFLVYSIGRGARLVAGDEQNGTLEVVLSTPVSRVRVLLETAGALVASVAALGGVLLIAALGGDLVTDMHVGVPALATGTLAMVLLGWEHGLLALAVGAATGRRGLAVGVAAGFALLSYILYVAATLVSSLSTWGPISPFHQALHSGPVGAGVPVGYVWMFLGGAVFLGASLPMFGRRDIATA